MNKRIIDYILLAKTIPEVSKRDGGVYTCSVGYSPQLGLIRLYPLPLVGMKKWHKYRVEVEKNKRDSREESWKLSSYTRFERFIGFEKDCIDLGRCKKEAVVSLLNQYLAPSISHLNKDRKSVGLIMTNYLNPYWDVNDRFINSRQIGMFEDVEIADFAKYTKHSKEKKCKLAFRDGDGLHDLQLNEWQYYEYQRKFGAKKDAFRYIECNQPNIVLLGNMFQYRSTWIALSVFRARKNHNINLFSEKSNRA